MKIHPDITTDRAVVAYERRALIDPGFCVACSHEQHDCEPDARKLRYEACGKKAVYGGGRDHAPRRAYLLVGKLKYELLRH